MSAKITRRISKPEKQLLAQDEKDGIGPFHIFRRYSTHPQFRMGAYEGAEIGPRGFLR